MKSMNSGVLLGTAAMALAFAHSALAAKPAGLPGNFPSKPIKIIIGASPGGGTDILGRLVFRHVAQEWGHPFVVENKTSIMGSALALEEVAKSPPDGHAYNVVSGSTYIGAAVVHMIPRNLMQVIDPVAQYTEQPFLMVTTSSLPTNSVKELVAFAKNNPGKLNYASSGLGGSAYLAAEYFKHEMGGLNITHIPYKGAGASYADLISGRTHISFGTSISAMPHIKKGSLKLLAVTSSKRLPNLPDVPTMGEFIPDFEFISFYGLVGPAGIPRSIVTALNATNNTVLEQPEVRKLLESDGSTIVSTTPEGFQRTLNDFVRRAQKLVKEANLDLRSAN